MYKDNHSAMDIDNAREVLPTNVRPTHYIITLEPDLKGTEYTGKVLIE